jgi:hypothetical protein
VAEVCSARNQLRRPVGARVLEGLCLIHSFGRLSFRTLREREFRRLNVEYSMRCSECDARRIAPSIRSTSISIDRWALRAGAQPESNQSC